MKRRVSNVMSSKKSESVLGDGRILLRDEVEERPNVFVMSLFGRMYLKKTS
jgi:hypothetical protein